MRYAVVIEKSENNYAAYVPDLPGCVATGRTLKETKAEIQEALRRHLHEMRENRLPVPDPSAQVKYIEVYFKANIAL